MPTEAKRTTRRQSIDSRLARAGWSVTPLRTGMPASASNATAVKEYEIANRAADYTPYDGGRVRGAVEAKKLTHSCQRLSCIELRQPQELAGIRPGDEGAGGLPKSDWNVQ